MLARRTHGMRSRPAARPANSALCTQEQCSDSPELTLLLALHTASRKRNALAELLERRPTGRRSFFYRRVPCSPRGLFVHARSGSSTAAGVRQCVTGLHAE